MGKDSKQKASRRLFRARRNDNTVEDNTPGQAPTQAFDVLGIKVISWEPHPVPGTVPPTQVWLIMKAQGIPYPIILRFKGPDSLDGIIESLTKHRIDVFGEFRS